MQATRREAHLRLLRCLRVGRAPRWSCGARRGTADISSGLHTAFAFNDLSVFHDECREAVQGVTRRTVCLFGNELLSTGTHMHAVDTSPPA